jgi:hypothetical protein
LSPAYLSINQDLLFSQGVAMSKMDLKRGDVRKGPASERWRDRLLPLMRAGLIVMAVFFFAASLVQYHLLYRDLRGMGPKTRLALEALETNLEQKQRASVDFLQWKTLVLLEQDTMAMRYQQINATLLLRTWTRYTGFLVGMVLALVGAFFILGRLKEETSQLSGESGGFKFALVTSSPGVILAVLGTLLMVVTLVVKFDFEVQDRPVYLPLHLMKEQVRTVDGLPPPGAFPQSEQGEAFGVDDIPKPPGK